MRLNRRSDTGFTLVELLVTVTVLAVVAVPLANVVIGFLRNTDDTSDRLTLSHDAQISAAYFARDVASVGLRDYDAAPTSTGDVPFKASIQLNAAYDAGGSVCGTAATPAAALRLLGDAWDTSAAAPVLGTTVVAYYLQGTELHRLKCAGATQSDSVVAHHVDPATLSITCSSTCTATTLPRSVTLSFTVTLPSVGPYPITLTGLRRQT